MESFKWGEQFETGLPEIDQQHQDLVSMVNAFGQMVAENASTNEHLLGTFQKLAAYAQKHFDTEEKLMSQSAVDTRHVDLHLSQHTDFLNEVSSMAESIDDTNGGKSRMLLEYLINWLVIHTLGTDQNMARQIAHIKAGAPPEEAYAKGEKEPSSSSEPLVHALTALFKVISSRNKALRDLNATLEAEVNKRTEELIKANEALERISITDPLTELPNRRFAMKQLQLLLEEATDSESLSCMMADADGFKEINDAYGHQAGDMVLKQLAKALRFSVRSDDIVCRLGGDEFVILCPDTDLNGVEILGGQIIDKIARLKVPVGKSFWNGSISIGVASTDQEIKDGIALLKLADEALYRAKRSGGNTLKQ
ncbi:MAG: GGDEF domain-containing protein [Desulfobacterales bacterium]|nr:GGDEF domain-containing protein [Desulfobacterales bacterium]